VASQSPPDVPTQQQEIQQRPPLRYGEPRSALLSNPGSIWCCVSFYLSCLHVLGGLFPTNFFSVIAIGHPTVVR
jgi:hypothetical protein